MSFEQATRDLTSPDPAVRLRAAQLLKEVAYPEAAIPLAALVTDPQDEVQLEAIAAELNIFLAEPIVPRKRVGFIVEVRNSVLAEPAFSAGPLALGARPVPMEVLTALRLGARDDNPRVALEALYAFGALACGAGRRRAARAAARQRPRHRARSSARPIRRSGTRPSACSAASSRSARRTIRSTRPSATRSSRR